MYLMYLIITLLLKISSKFKKLFPWTAVHFVMITADTCVSSITQPSPVFKVLATCITSDSLQSLTVRLY